MKFTDPATGSTADITRIAGQNLITANFVVMPGANHWSFGLPNELAPATPQTFTLVDYTTQIDVSNATGMVLVQGYGSASLSMSLAWQANPVAPPPGLQLLVATDAEQAVIDQVASIYTFPFGTAIPPQAEDLPLFGRVIQVGGAERDLTTDEPLLTIEMFAHTETVAAEKLNIIVASAQQAASRFNRLGNLTCYGVRLVSTPQNYPLPSVPTHKRYITTIAPALRRAVVTI